MNPKEAILKIKALFEDMPVEAPKQEVPKETKVQMEDYTLADGTKVSISELAVGGTVTMVDGSPAPMGEYKLADGTSIQVDDKGVIIEVASPAEDVVPEEAPVPAEMIKKQDEKMAEMAAAYDEKINQLLQSNQDLIQKIKDIEFKNKEGFSLVVSMLEDFSKVPSADPIEAPKSYKFEQSKDIKFERLNKYRNAILNNKN